MERREFIRGVGAGIITATAATSPIAYLLHKRIEALESRTRLEHDLNQRLEAVNIEKRIYNELPSNCHIATYRGDIESKVEGEVYLKKKTVKGVGIFLDNYYISMEHIPAVLTKNKIKTSLGSVTSYNNIENKTMTVGKKSFEILIEDAEKDILIAKEIGGNSFPNFPCSPQHDINYLDTAYIIGNPNLMGTNIRKGNISDLDGYGDVYKNPKSFFGINVPTHGGDSGSPIVNDRFELLGLSRFHMSNKFSYANRISVYLDAIKSLS